MSRPECEDGDGGDGGIELFNDAPLIFMLRRYPYERAERTSNTCYDFFIEHIYSSAPAKGYVAGFLQTFKELPSRQRAASCSPDRVTEMLSQP